MNQINLKKRFFHGSQLSSFLKNYAESGKKIYKMKNPHKPKEIANRNGRKTFEKSEKIRYEQGKDICTKQVKNSGIKPLKAE